MRSRNNRERQKDRHPKQRSAFRRGEKALIFLRRGTIVLLILSCIALVVLAARLSARPFVIRNIEVSGNQNVEEYDIKRAALKHGESLLGVSFYDLVARIRRIAWIKKVSLRKQFPDTLLIQVEETTPRALLKFKGKLFLVSAEGTLLEEIKEKGTYFLPLIAEIDPVRDRGGISEAMKLVDALHETNILAGKESTEIRLQPVGLTMNMDGETLIIGYGEYGDKLVRWKELEPELRRNNLSMVYVDLRFKDKVVVKPLNTADKNKTASVNSKKDPAGQKNKKQGG